MAELEATPLAEGNGLGPQGAVAAPKIDAGSCDPPRDHDDFDDGDDDDFGHFATATAAPPASAADVKYIPAADDAVTSEVAVTCDSTNGTLLPNQCLGDSDDDSETSQDTSGLARRASAELPFSIDTSGVKREDSFDDFQQAQAVAPPFEAALAPVDEGSDFADFEQACDAVGADSCEWGDSKGGGFADFAAFGDAAKTAVEDGDWADDGWKSFAGAEDSGVTSVVLPVVLPQEETVSSQLVLGEGSFENLLQSAYTLEELSPVSAEDKDIVALSCCEVHVRLWEQLQDLDHAPSLKFSWNGSQSCQHLLQSLSIDSRNIQAGADSAIPPAQFDWTSSGLVNPLEQPAASTLLDLEFLSSLSSATVGSSPPTSSLEKEFLGLSSSEEAPVLSQSSAPSKLQELLRNNVSTLSSTRRRPSLLSGEAQAILDRLPDLSFMQARVLMFPVHLD
ncbi:aftiphilin isoform X3 [Dermacentor albipictus]|uniref:aftiphilin isoform X3 n=1 Tax=Dermacentor albipictus TaxID=60249 RepID=UPI0031FD7355